METIAHLKSKAAGYVSGMDNRCLKALSEEVVENIATACADIGKPGSNIPAEWHGSRASFLFRKGDPSILSNYRMLSISPIITRFVSAAAARACTGALCEMSGEHQFGFRPRRSTTDAIQIVQDCMSRAMQEGREQLIITIDVARAFDKLDRRAIHQLIDEVISPNHADAGRYLHLLYQNQYVHVSSYGEVDRTSTGAG